MPYASADELPAAVKKLPKHAREIWMSAFNNAFKEYDEDEGKAAATAWAAVKKAGYKKEGDKWVKEAISFDGGETWEELTEGLSFEQIQRKIEEKLRPPAGSNKSWPWIEETHTGYVIIKDIDKYFRYSYEVEDGKVVLGEPVEVRKTFVPVEEAAEARGLTKIEFENAVKFVGKPKNDLITVKVISPGWGSTCYYPKEVLERDCNVFKGAPMFWDHPGEAEKKDRPERSLRDLAGVIKTSPEWQENGVDGPGIYAKAKVYSDFQEQVKEKGGDIGVSIRAIGLTKDGEAEGRKGKIAEALVASRSVDFVTVAGAGGKVILEESRRDEEEVKMDELTIEKLKESRPDLYKAVIAGATVTELRESNGEALKELAGQANQRVYGDKEKIEEARRLEEKEMKELRESVQDKDKRIAALEEKVKLQEQKQAEREALAEAKGLIDAKLTEKKFPAFARERVSKELMLSVPMSEAKLDKAKLEALIEAKVKEEVDYLTKAGCGRIVDCGESGNAGSSRQAEMDKMFGVAEVKK